jgi:RNA polymerase sigma-70 factor (sigma-E family)
VSRHGAVPIEVAPDEPERNEAVPISAVPVRAVPDEAVPRDAGESDQGIGDFAEFVAAREGALQRTAWLLTGDWALAEDLVQTALAKTWPRWHRIQRRESPEIYVRQVVVNTWLTWTRRKWRGEQAFATVPDEQAPGDHAAEVVVRLAVRLALDALTDRQRAVVVMRVFDDMPEASVARALGISVGTVKSTAAQALARLRQDPQLASLMDREAL